MQRRKVKAKDQPPPDPHREYLDAESTDDEEKHKHKVEDVEEELRPVYDDTELTELVNCVKEMTTLSGMPDPDDWSYYTESVVRKFFLNPASPVLSVYRMYGRIMAALRFPVIPVQEFTYFVREPQEVFRMDSFRNCVLFGTVNDKSEMHILTLIRDTLAPIFLRIETWPDSILFRFNSYLISQAAERKVVKLKSGPSEISGFEEQYEFVINSEEILETELSLLGPTVNDQLRRGREVAKEDGLKEEGLDEVIITITFS
ncbi:uncharacterized protein LOC143347270 [Colletes latitarsis]|uniref:uncharacterized protein LOC143347270 n=1 Tax=Colletes latitarsis TaxID=2605962 RepID=UPI004036F8A3